MNNSFVEGDTLAGVKITCLDADSGAPIDLTGQTVTLRFKCGISPLKEVTMAIGSPPTAGIATYVFQPGELVAGNMILDVKRTTAGGLVLTSLAKRSFYVRKRLS